jgi:hypothetical protein
MNPEKNSELTVQALMALKQEGDAVRVITDRLRVNEMGPADHIRTKHEVKAFVEAGSEVTAEALVRRSAERRQVGRKLAESIAQRHAQKFSP